jgi:hypothetical protein
LEKVEKRLNFFGWRKERVKKEIKSSEKVEKSRMIDTKQSKNSSF